MTQQIKAKQRIFLSLIILAFTIPSLLTFILTKDGDAKLEFRPLAEFPRLPTTAYSIRTWPREFEKFANDRFPFRGSVVKRIAAIAKELDISLSREACFGNEGWMFLKNRDEIMQKSLGTVPDQYAAANNFATSVKELNRRITNLGCEFTFVVVPNKCSVYTRYLPNGYLQSRETYTDSIIAALKGEEFFNFVDLREGLTAASMTTKVYDQFDTHWNDAGAFIGYQQIMKHIPSTQPLEADQVKWNSIERTGDLARISGLSRTTEVTTTASVNCYDDDSRLLQDHQVQRIESGEIALALHPSSMGPRTLVVGDSFTYMRLYKFLQQTFPTTLFVHGKYFEGDITDVIKDSKIELVIVALVERSYNQSIGL